MLQKSKLQELLTKSSRNIHHLRDVRVAGLLIFGIVALIVSWSGVSVIQTNYELQQRIARLEQENELTKLQNDNLRLRNQYYQTDQYLELQARRQFSKAGPGETLLLVPREVALDHTVDSEEEKTNDIEVDRPSKPTYQKNFEAWMEFLFRRNVRKL